jgi:hypothetical protein
VTLTKRQREPKWAEDWREQTAEEQFSSREMSLERYAGRYELGWKL